MTERAPANERILRIGCGAGYSGDRIEPAVELAEGGDLDYLVFECLAERTMAIAQQAKARDPRSGFNPLLIDRMTAVLPACVKNGVRIITNMGAANPAAAAAAVCQLARGLGLGGLTIAAVTGDDVGDRDGGWRDSFRPPSPVLIVSANVYLGAGPLIEALAHDADVILAGRVADPALFLAPMVHEFGWRMDDWPLLGAGTLVGHLLECAGQVTGGYFADPGFKDVAGLGRLGFPIAEISTDGTAVITKVPGSGGTVNLATCKEQVLYEVHDPAAYVTPDVVADFSGVRMEEAGADRVRVSGAGGRPRPETLKVSIGYLDGFIGEGQISYGGPGAVDRARLALAIVAERFRAIGFAPAETRFELIGVNALHGDASPVHRGDPYEVRARVVGRTASLKDARRIGEEVEALYTNGPSGGGGVTQSSREVLAIASALIPREAVTPEVSYEVA